MTLEYLLTFIWTLFDVSGLMLLVDGFFERRRSVKAIIGIVLVSSVIITYLLWFPVSESMEKVFSLAALTITILLCHRTGILYAILVLVMSYILVGIVEVIGSYGVSALLGTTYEELAQKKLQFTVLTTGCKLLELFIFYMIRKLRGGRKHAHIRSSWLLLTILFPTFSFTLLLFIFMTFQTRNDLSVYGVIFSAILVPANIAILYLLNAMEKRTQEEKELHLMNQQMEIQTKNFLALEKSYRAQRSATHEFRNQLQTLTDLLDAGESERALAYLRDLQQTESIRDLPVHTRHPIMDAILNQKYQLAQEHGIDIQFQVNDLSGLKLETDAMVLLFTNLLDNAIEACLRLDTERIIRCSILADDGLYLSVKNTSPPVTIRDSSIPTSKHPPEEHGYGLMSVQRVLKERNAEYSFDYQDGWFRFAAEIPE